MAKKKSAKKISIKKTTKKRITKTTKKVSKRPVKKVAGRSAKKIIKKPLKRRKISRMIYASKRKINLILTKLVFFAVLSLASSLLYFFLKNDILKNLFLLLAMILGFVAVAFLIVLLVFLILKVMRK